MTITFHRYNHTEDYSRVSDFLIRYYQPDNLDGNWLEPIWEYMHSHPALDAAALGKIGVWKAAGEIVAVTHYESRLGEAFFQFHPENRHLMEEMLTYAEENLNASHPKDNGKYLRAFVGDWDDEFIALVKSRGYQHQANHDRPLAKFTIPNPYPEIKLPSGFRLTNLADDPDWSKVHRVLWRGFNHQGEPTMSAVELEERRTMFDTPKARRDLKIAAAERDGRFVSFCGMFFEVENQYALVEPVATDPDFRRMGLGKATVLEGIRRCAEIGANVAYVGSNLPFYLAMGFEVVNTSECWVKQF